MEVLILFSGNFNLAIANFQIVKPIMINLLNVFASAQFLFISAILKEIREKESYKNYDIM